MSKSSGKKTAVAAPKEQVRPEKTAIAATKEQVRHEKTAVAATKEQVRAAEVSQCVYMQWKAR